MKKNYSMKNLRKQAIVKELGDEEYNKPGEVDDNSRGVYSRGKKHFDGRSSYIISEATIHWKR